ncbi:EamA family transporter [Piscinibacter koreensis]|uniref:EamA family transporter n=1 Tax=Piscinibacter koreensis TaxID=2742824 RepID=A0A7Y6TUV1_9BURK|nr:EamA family transporter [Schlegelella koreensis]NUZ04368.1 EamA family transporter [Schlegelella koreensis]
MTHRAPVHWLLPPLATIAAMASFQVGAALAKILFPVVGPQGSATLRLGLGALTLLLLTRPWRRWPRGAPLLPLVGLGCSMAGVIVMFYLALERLPLAVAMALQFLGPLTIPVAGSRRFGDLVWAALAAAGVWLLVRVDASAARGLDPVGIAWALGAAVAWGSYVLLGRRASVAFGRSTAALSLSVAALLVLPAGVYTAGSALLAPALLPLALLMALFSSAIPFSLDFWALPRMPPRTFAVLMSLEPAFGVLAGLVILGEALSLAQLGGVALVVCAAAGAAWSAAGERPG